MKKMCWKKIFKSVLIIKKLYENKLYFDNYSSIDKADFIFHAVFEARYSNFSIDILLIFII